MDVAQWSQIRIQSSGLWLKHIARSSLDRRERCVARLAIRLRWMSCSVWIGIKIIRKRLAKVDKVVATLLPGLAVGGAGLAVIGVDDDQPAVGTTEADLAHRWDLWSAGSSTGISTTELRCLRLPSTDSRSRASRLKSAMTKISDPVGRPRVARFNAPARQSIEALAAEPGRVSARNSCQSARRPRAGRKCCKPCRVAEGHAADAVLQPARGPADQGRRARRLHRFEGSAGAKGHVRPAVDAEHHAALALFAKNLQVRLVDACRDLPVHVADIVALAVLAHLLEVDASAPKHRGIESCEGRVDEMVGGDAEGGAWCLSSSRSSRRG